MLPFLCERIGNLFVKIKNPVTFRLRDFWRRERDLNPRYAINVHTISNRAPSTTQPSLQTCVEHEKQFNSNRRRKKYYNRKMSLVKRKNEKSKKFDREGKAGKIYSLIQ